MSSLLKEHFINLSLAGKLVTIHSAIILLAILLYPTEIFFLDKPFDDLYPIYFFVPGIHICWLGGQVSRIVQAFLFSIYSPHTASILGIVIIPGFVGLVVGGVQWYLIGKIICRFVRHPATRIKLCIFAGFLNCGLYIVLAFAYLMVRIRS